MTRGWLFLFLRLFFHVKCIFRNKCLCFERDFLLVWLQLLQQSDSGDAGWTVTLSKHITCVAHEGFPVALWRIHVEKLLCSSLILIICVGLRLLRTYEASWAAIHLTGGAVMSATSHHLFFVSATADRLLAPSQSVIQTDSKCISCINVNNNSVKLKSESPLCPPDVLPHLFPPSSPCSRANTGMDGCVIGNFRVSPALL